MEQKLYGIISLAAKAGRLVSGEFSVLDAVKRNKAALVLISEDASDNTKKLFSDKASYRNIEVLVFGQKEDLGKAIGKGIRACIAFTDTGFSELFLNRLRGVGEKNGKNQNS